MQKQQTIEDPAPKNIPPPKCAHIQAYHLWGLAMHTHTNFLLGSTTVQIQKVIGMAYPVRCTETKSWWGRLGRRKGILCPASLT